MRLRSGVHTALDAEGGVILDERSGRWTALTSTAAVGLHLLLTSQERWQAAERYAAWFALTPDQAEQQLAAVEREMAGRGLLATPRRRRWRWWR